MLQGGKQEETELDECSNIEYNGRKEEFQKSAHRGRSKEV